MSKLLVVLGATGLQVCPKHYISLNARGNFISQTKGSSVIKAVLRRNPEYRIRGITRNANSEASQSLAKEGVEMVSADRYDQDGLAAAFKA